MLNKKISLFMAAILILECVLSTGAAWAEHEEASKDAKLQELIRELEATSGTTVPEVVNDFREKGRAFEAEVVAFIVRWASAKGPGRTGLARDFATRIWKSTAFEYNMKISILGASLQNRCRAEALAPVATELCRLWDKTKWKRRLIVGGAVVAAVVVTVYTGGMAIGNILAWGSEVVLGLDALLVIGTTVTVDVAAVLLLWHFWKRNPELVLFPEATRDILDKVKKGAKVTVEELTGFEEGLEEACPCFGGIEGNSN